ncbi:rab-GTPase-TBC domain-containing protein [Tuber borchii]|uniref:Rab-GTPase-TBC domain-containing protein n=1 Tax=Tuber borchii TaxID=42251 RepID=A0A2T6ZAQ0_TUBBO|nr:rab-GTPase-TBC domain-containing protein [Tuber borchii]
MSSSKLPHKFTPLASPTASYYDISEDDENGYSTITNTSTSLGVKLLYSKSKAVYVHPTPSKIDNILAFDNPSTLPAVATTLLLAWLPESAPSDAYDTYVKVDLINAETPPRQSYLAPPPPATVYAPGTSCAGNYAFAIPVSEIYSLLIRPPNLGCGGECASTIAQSKKRVRASFDPFGEGGGLFWGGDEVLRWLRRYVTVYLVEPSQEDLLSFGSKPNIVGHVGETPPLMFKEARWGFLEKVSRVTRLTRRTVEDILDSPKVPLQVRRLLKNPDVVNLQDEFDSVRLYLARWAMGIDEQSEMERQQDHQVVWANRDALELEDSAVSGSTKLNSDKRKPVSLEERNGWFDPKTGKLAITANKAKERIFHGGVEPGAARKVIWVWLLGYPWDSTKDECITLMNSKRDEYVRLKGKWWDDLDRRNNDEYWRDKKNRIEKGVHRTDRGVPIFAGEDIPHPNPDSPFAETGTNVHLEQMKDMLLTYNEYNTDLGYVQGRCSSLLGVGFMEQMERNFFRDQTGMRAQLVALDYLVQLMDPKLYAHLESADSTNCFSFRMLLVWYKWEFKWDDVLRLWEAMRTNFLSSLFHLFIALAILERHLDVIMDHRKQFDEVLKDVNELSTTIELSSFLRTVEAVDRKSGFVAPGDGSSTMRRRRTENAYKRDPSNSSGALTPRAAVNKGRILKGEAEGWDIIRAK